MLVRELWSRPFPDAPHTKQVLGKPLLRYRVLLQKMIKRLPIGLRALFFWGSGTGASEHIPNYSPSE